VGTNQYLLKLFENITRVRFFKYSVQYCVTQANMSHPQTACRSVQPF